MIREDMSTVAVLMSTYNGGKYIQEQLDSIFKQKNIYVKLFVRDDGSSDETIEILEEYKKNHPLTIIEDGEKVGPGESFMRLVYKYADEPNLDYYAFADQDDIWLEEKLWVAVNWIKNARLEGPLLYSSNQFLYVDGKNIGNRHKEKQSTELIPHITRNMIAGCTFVFNKELAQLVRKAERPAQSVIKYRLHDAWMMLVAITCGNAIYDGTSHMLYRIHAENAVGVKGVSAMTRLRKLQRLFWKKDDANIRMITAQQLLALFTDINEKDKEILKHYADYQKSWKNKKELILNERIRAECLENQGIFILKVIFNFV